ncbi:MAG: hypothetical protein QM749_11535 [Aquabacterium sp.]
MMDTQLSVLTSGNGWSNGASSARRVDTGASQADLQFWQDVFDRAKGIGVDAGATGIADEASVPSPQSASPRTTAQALVRTQTMAATQAAELLDHDAPLAGFQRAAVGAAQPAKPVWTLEGQVLHSQASGSASVSDDGQGAAHIERIPGGEAAASDTPEAASSLNAHVMQTAEGDWKVALRTTKKLSTAQALSAVADALARDGVPGGQVSEVMLNGTRIYQQQTPPGPAASSTFELKC